MRLPAQVALRNARCASAIVRWSRRGSIAAIAIGGLIDSAPWLVLLSYPLVIAARYVISFCHEVGHAVCAIIVGGRLTAFMVRPFALRFRPLRFRLIWPDEARDRFGGGRVEYAFAHRHGMGYALVASGGMMASTIIAAICLAGAIGPFSRSVGAIVLFGVAILAIGDAFASAIPYRGSDGESLRRIAMATRLSRSRASPKCRA